MLVFRQHKKFSDGFTDLCGRTSVINDSIMPLIENALKDERHLTIWELATKFGAIYGTVHTVLTVKLKMSKAHARWVPRLMTDIKKQRHRMESRSFLHSVEKEGDIKRAL